MSTLQGLRSRSGCRHPGWLLTLGVAFTACVLPAEARAQAGAPPTPAAAQAKEPPAQPQEAAPPVNFDVVVSAPRIDIPLRVIPAATSIVSYDELKALPRGIGAE
ncbi:MAG: hypothetical protein NTY02_16260 [Acidobacteria bacterium]|nr:hypothetical protein [Acidobacteriota bacterium]